MTPLLFPVQPNKEVSVEKSFKIDEEDGAKPKLTETKKVNNFLPVSHSVTGHHHRDNKF